MLLIVIIIALSSRLPRERISSLLKKNSPLPYEQRITNDKYRLWKIYKKNKKCLCRGKKKNRSHGLKGTSRNREKDTDMLQQQKSSIWSDLAQRGAIESWQVEREGSVQLLAVTHKQPGWFFPIFLVDAWPSWWSHHLHDKNENWSRNLIRAIKVWKSKRTEEKIYSQWRVMNAYLRSWSCACECVNMRWSKALCSFHASAPYSSINSKFIILKITRSLNSR